MSQILNRSRLIERWPAVHGDSGFAMMVINNDNDPKPPPIKDYHLCAHCGLVAEVVCTGDAPSKECWEDWKDLLADEFIEGVHGG